VGGGETLERLAEQLGLRDLTAFDVSRTSLQRTEARLPHARTALVSILDEGAIRPWVGRFDVVLMAAVLHHLVGPTRSRSHQDACLGLSNAMRLTKPGGVLVVLEPVFAPRASAAAVFWTKRIVTRWTSDRVSILGYWNNIGAPVVSFYSTDQVREMVADARGELIAEHVERQHLGYADRLIRKANLTAIARSRPEVLDCQ